MPISSTTGNLRSVLSNTDRPRQPFILIQHDLSVTPWPIIRHIIQGVSTIVLALQHRKSQLISSGEGNIIFLDLTGNVPGFTESWKDPRESLIDAIKNSPDGPLTILIDSLETLCSDLSSVSQTVRFIQNILNLVHARNVSHHMVATSRLIIPISRETPDLMEQLLEAGLNSKLTLLKLHPPHLVDHISTKFLTPMNAQSCDPPARFWSLFYPTSQRGDGEKMLLDKELGARREFREGVIEVVIRGGKRSVETTLEGWRVKDDTTPETVEACFCSDLATLEIGKTRPLGAVVEENVLEKLASFNLSLTESQLDAKAKVVLPYAFSEIPSEREEGDSTILYDPDSADDIDDDDPDEDLDI